MSFVRVAEGDDAISESEMELIMEAFEVQCHTSLQQAIRTIDGLGIEYDENVVCDVCRSVLHGFLLLSPSSLSCHYHH